MKKIILILLMITATAAFAKAQDTTKVKRTPEERAAHATKALQKKLNLTADQTKQISTILADRADNMDKMKGVKGSRLNRVQAMADADKKIDAILTDGQRKTYAQMKENAKEKQMSKRKGAAASTEPAAPPVQ